MLAPKRIRHRKQMKGRMRGKSQKGNFLAFGSYGLQALGRGWMSNQQIEAARIAITRHIKRGGQVFIRVFPDKPITKKPAETRMGKGKGAPEGWVAVVRPGRIIYEVEGVTPEVAKEALRLASQKIPFPTKYIEKQKEEVAANEIQ